MKIGTSATVYTLSFATDGSRFLLLRKAKPEWQRGRLNGIGGMVEPPYETVAECMVREFEEETGIATTPSIWRLFETMKGSKAHDPQRETAWEVHCFVALVPPSFIDTAHASNQRLAKLGQVREWTEIVPLVGIEYLNPSFNANLPWLVRKALDCHPGTTRSAVSAPAAGETIYR